MYDRILVPLDTGAESDEALPHARALSTAFGSEVTLLLVAESANTTLASIAEAFGASGSVAAAIERENTLEAVGQAYLTNIRETEGEPTWRLLVVEGDPGDEIVRVSSEEGFDLIVMATHTRSGLGLLMHRSVADHVMHRGSVPVLVIPVEEA